jgi:hypothetical protein
MCGDQQTRRVISINAVWRWVESKVQSHSPAKSPAASILPQAFSLSRAKRTPSPSKIAPALAPSAGCGVLAKIRVRRPHLHRRHRPTTATMPQEVKQKSGIAIGLNKGHVRPPRNGSEDWKRGTQADQACVYTEGHPSPGEAPCLAHQGPPQQAHRFREGCCEGGFWVRLSPPPSPGLEPSRTRSHHQDLY